MTSRGGHTSWDGAGARTTCAHRGGVRGRGALLRVLLGVEAIALVALLGCASPASITPGTAERPSGTATAAAAVDATRAIAAVTGEESQDATSASAEEQIRRLLDDRWCAGVNSHDLELKLSAYADVVSPFYGKARATKAEVRKVFGGAFAQYKRMRQRLERVDIKVSGDLATVVIYKTRVYDGDPGWAEERLGLARKPDGWRIVSEQDIRASD